MRDYDQDVKTLLDDPEALRRLAEHHRLRRLLKGTNK
jgi:hypothetical protein